MIEPAPLLDYAAPLEQIAKAERECYRQLEEKKDIKAAQAELLKMAKGIRDVQRWIDNRGKENAGNGGANGSQEV